MVVVAEQRKTTMSKPKHPLSGWLVSLAVVLALCTSFLVRVRLYDSEGTYRGFGHIGTAPVWFCAAALCVGYLAYRVWRVK